MAAELGYAPFFKKQFIIAVLNNEGTKASFNYWQNTINYLNQALPNWHFYLVPLNERGIEDAIAKQNISLVLTDALQSSRLQKQRQYRPILSLKRQYQGQFYQQDAGVLITRANHPTIHSIQDLKNKRLIASSQQTLSFKSVWHEIQHLKPIATVDFLGFPEENILHTLLNNSVDAGVVSAGLLEKMASQWQINIDDFRILHPQKHLNYPLLHSSALYPQWALNANVNLSKPVIEMIRDTLLQQNFQINDFKNSAMDAAYGWQTVLDYRKVSSHLDVLYYQNSDNIVTGLTQLTFRSPMIISLLLMVLLLLFLPSRYYIRHTLIVYSFTLSLLLLIASIFYQFFDLWVSDYQTQQVQIAKSNVRGTAETIYTYISQQHLAAQRFAYEYHEILEDPFIFSSYPPNLRRTNFEKNLDTQFPNIFKYAVFDEYNHVLYSSDERSVSLLCENNIRTHRQIQEQPDISIHGYNNQTYHFDLLVNINSKMVLMISLRIQRLLDILHNANIPGQNLLILTNDQRDQVAWSAEGVRDSFEYGQYLSSKEHKRFLYGQHIKGTKWYLEALYQEGWFKQYHYRLQTWMVAVYSLVVLILLIFVWRLTYETRLREHLQASNQAKSNQRYKILLEHAVDAFISTDEYGNIEEFNPAAEQMLGYDKKNIQGQNFQILMPEEAKMQQQGIAYLRTYLKNQSEHHLGYHLKARHKHGYYFPVYMTLMDTGIEGSYRYGIMLKDMTILKRSEERLIATRERLQYALDGANEGYWDWDISSGKIYFSPSWEGILGYKAGELLPHIDTLKQRIHKHDKARAKHLLQAHFAGKNEYYQVEYRLKNKQNNWIWTLGRGKVVSRDALGQPLRMVGTTSNIQERKNLEHALQQAKEQAEKTAAAKSQFLSNMSHEIRTPLNGVLGMAQLLRKTQLNGKQQEYIDLILDSGDALMTIINDILDLSKLESRQITLEHIPFNLETLLHDILCISCQHAREKSIIYIY